MRKLTVVFTIILFIITSLSAQNQENTNVSDQDIEKFVNAYETVQQIAEQSQEEMVKAVEDEGIDVLRYNEIMQAFQNPEVQHNATEEEVEKIEKANKELEKIETKTNKIMEEAIADEGLTINRYQEIIAAIQSSQDLQLKFQEEMNK